ncbi:uncharacterized protein PV07_03895 [Cladophialophora immunda]|uniref:Uncharacterized protein n=1 Tax=Cladophialophora immunda TaxID=569365 RepID=A0A0D1ZVY9_9EURO|nr:uncharacterized protein PV07_03895 [Cladophialophora immunda]KIW32341.1 hypothetical protein PV07_03895 [Cladophialophora immunda]
MFVFKAIKEFLGRHNSSSPSSRATSEEPDNAVTDDSPTIAKVRDKGETELHDIAAKLDMSIAANPAMKSHDHPSDDYFPRMYKQFRHGFSTSRGSWDSRSWMAFDMFKWSEIYTAERDAGLLPTDQDHGSLPMHWTLCMAMILYMVLLVTRQSLDCIMKDILRRLKDFPHLATTRLRLQTPEMRQLRYAERQTVRGSEAFNRSLGNMALELSVALGKVKKVHGNDEAEEEVRRIPICEVLRREIHTEHPQLELPDLTMPVMEV